MRLGSTGLPEEESMAPSPTSFESFIFSFSFLGRGVLVPTLQMCESALPQAAPAVCLTRGAVSGRMDFLNLSSCFLYRHLLFCFSLTTFSYSSQYGSSLSSPWTFSHPFLCLIHPHHPLLLRLPLYPVLLLSPACWNPTPGTSPRTSWFCTCIPLCVGHSVGTPCPWPLLDWSPATLALWVLSLSGDMDLARKRAILLISQFARAFCEQITDSGGFWRLSTSVF